MKLLTLLKSTSSRIRKEQILKDFATPLDLKVFNYAYDKNKVYHIKQVGNIDYDNLGEPTEAMFDTLNNILNKSIGYTPTEISKILELWSLQGDLIKLIVSKDLDCGVSVTTINKVYPGTVPQFKIMLAREVPLAKVKFPCLAQIKYDGVRIVIIRRANESVKFFTRNGKEVKLPSIAKTINEFSFSSYLLDTEVTLSSGKITDRTSVSGMINSAMHEGAIEESSLVFHVFDALTIEEFDTSFCLRPYRTRFKHAMFIMEAMLNNQIIPALTIPCDTVEQIQSIYDELIANGYEGLILKSDDHKYSFKRSKDWVKMKETKTVDLTCINLIPGTGKYSNCLGALTCKGIVKGVSVLVNVGSGLTDAQRQSPTVYEDYLDKTIEVKYNTVIQDSQTGRYSLFLPRFVCVKIDK